MLLEVAEERAMLDSSSSGNPPSQWLDGGETASCVPRARTRSLPAREERGALGGGEEFDLLEADVFGGGASREVERGEPRALAQAPSAR